MYSILSISLSMPQWKSALLVWLRFYQNTLLVTNLPKEVNAQSMLFALAPLFSAIEGAPWIFDIPAIMCSTGDLQYYFTP